MEQQVLQLLADVQLAAEAPRKRAEIQLAQLYSDESFPISLCAISSHDSVPPNLRQASLLVLKKFVLATWSPQFDEYKSGTTPVAPATKERLRSQLLDIATGSTTDRKVKSTASYVVSKIASVDFPDEWPTLLPHLLEIIPKADDGQLQGSLRVLSDLVDEGFDDDQFFKVVRDLVKILFDVVTDEKKKLFRRAMAVSVFRSCFDTLHIVKSEHNKEVKAFADEILNQWLPLFIAIMKMGVPTAPSASDENVDGGKEEEWRGMIALKLQVVKTLMKIREVFPSLLAPQSPVLFSAIWQELVALQEQYHALYITDERQGRLEDSDGLPYTLDFLVLEDIDFMQSCLRAPPVRKELQEQLANQGSADGTNGSSWVFEMMNLMIAYGQITSEEEGLWEIDVNIFLSEETSVTANYTPRTACGDLVIKLCEWIHTETLQGLLKCTEASFSSTSWKAKEASLFILGQLLGDFLDVDRGISSNFANGFADFAKFAISQDDMFLRARGYLCVGLLARTSDESLRPVALGFAQQALKAVNNDSAEVVRVACIRALQDYIQALPADVTRPLQAEILTALSNFVAWVNMEDADDSDDLLVTLVETLRDVVLVDENICVAPGSGALDLLFSLANKGARQFQVTMLVNEAFEEVAKAMAEKGGDAYVQLCSRVLPSLTGAFDVATLTEESALANLAAELMAKLAEHGSQPLPQGFVAAAIPKLNRLLLSSQDGSLLRPGTEALRHMLAHDHRQVFDWRDENGKSGMEVCLIVIDRLLGQQVDDNAASEVGGLAAELVEKAGSEQLGPYLLQLLTAVAIRLASAEEAPFIQSLILVFARLSLVNAKDVVDFLAQVQVGNENGLQVVMSKWLINSVHFAGYEEIRQNAFALSKLYLLQDPRLQQIMVQGDLVVPTSDRIMTRSRTRTMPDQYTVVSVPLKIIKVLIGDLASASGTLQKSAAFGADLDDNDGDEDNDEWEDVPGIDLGLQSVKNDLMAYADGTGGPFGREQDAETGQYLGGFFSEVVAKDIGGFKELYASLTAEEQQILNAC